MDGADGPGCLRTSNDVVLGLGGYFVGCVDALSWNLEAVCSTGFCTGGEAVWVGVLNTSRTSTALHIPTCSIDLIYVLLCSYLSSPLHGQHLVYVCQRFVCSLNPWRGCEVKKN